MGMTVMKMYRDDKEVKWWYLTEVLDVHVFKGKGRIEVALKDHDHEWGFTIDALPWDDDCDLKFGY